jgi:hypothetical protein
VMKTHANPFSAPMMILSMNVSPGPKLKHRSSEEAQTESCRARATRKGPASAHEMSHHPGNPAVIGPRALRPEALRPRLSTGLPLSTARSIHAPQGAANVSGTRPFQFCGKRQHSRFLLIGERPQTASRAAFTAVLSEIRNEVRSSAYAFGTRRAGITLTHPLIKTSTPGLYGGRLARNP